MLQCAGYMMQMSFASTAVVLSVAPEESICFMRLKQDCFNRPISSAPDAHVDVLLRQPPQGQKCVTVSIVTRLHDLQGMHMHREGMQCAAAKRLRAQSTPRCLMQGSGADGQDTALPEPWILQLPGLRQPGPVLHTARPGGPGHLRLGRVLPARRSW